jgi:EmrB/QacA subfamily drug resistance transporter
MTSPTTSTDTQQVSRSPRRWLILAVLCLSLLVLVVDNTVLTVAIPTLISDLHASSSQIQWMLDAYILVFAGLLLTAGALSDRHGRRRGLIVGLAIFGLASLAASYAQNPGQLIAARAAMGVGGAFLMPGTLSIITTVFAGPELRKAIAIWSSVLMVGAVAGPSLGGLLLQHFWWGSVFLINVPIAAIGIIAAVLVIPESRGPALRPDLVGAALSVIGLGGIVWAVIDVGHSGWGSAQVLGGFAAGVTGLALFAVRQRRTDHPMLPLSLFGNRSFSGASLSVVLLSLASAGTLLALTQYLQFVLGFDPLRAGLALLPMIVAALIFNFVGVAIDKRLGTRWTVSLGLLVLAGGFGVLTTIGPHDGYLTVAVALGVLGIGSGIAGPAAYASLLGSLPPERAGVGSAINDTVQQVGQALSVAVLGSVLTSLFSSSLPATVTGPARDSIGDALAEAARTDNPALADIARTSFVHALGTTSWVGLAAGLAAAVVAAAVLPRRPTG